MAQKQDPRRLAILLGILALVVVVVVVFAVMSGGDGDDEGATSTTGEAAPDTTSETTGPDDTEPDGTAPDGFAPDDETFDVFATKNPFEPVISPIGGGDDLDGDGLDGIDGIDGDGTTTTTFPSGITPTVPNGAPTTTIPFTGGGTGGEPPSIEPVAPEAVALLDIFDENGERRVRVRVGSTVHTVGVGETFATNYRVVSIGQSCAEFLFGDDPFELCEGEEVVK